ncbi:MAG: hypothetical protein HC830_01250 [Bacteroidetes bacterium]|nr:hypothetical protein [Bacteroidota bacterium]
MEGFVKQYKIENTDIDLSLTEDGRTYLLTIIKAYIARDVWGNAEFYEIFNQTEEEYISALNVLDNWQSNLNTLQLK